MPTFDAGLVADPLDYDFTRAGVNAKGTIKEPTDKAIGKYLNDVKTVMTELSKIMGYTDVDTEDPAALIEALDQLDPEVFVKQIDGMAKAAADLCGGHPTLTEIRALPLRVRKHFFVWLQNEVVNPEAGPGAGTAVVTPIPRAVAG